MLFRSADVLDRGGCGRKSEKRAVHLLMIPHSDPVEELSVSCGRQCGSVLTKYRMENQDPGTDFVKLNEIGYEPYQIYFKVIP